MNSDAVIGADGGRIPEFGIIVTGQIGFGDYGEYILTADIDIEHYRGFATFAI